MKAVEFLKPRLVGSRFEGHAIPLEVLKDLAVLEEMIVEVAKWAYLRDHPERKRSPRGFMDGIQLKLTGIEDGSAKPVISLFVASALLFPPEGQRYFEEARDSIIAAVAAAEKNEIVTKHLPEKGLTYFDRIGRSLREGEALEFSTSQQPEPARLTKETRRRLVFASESARSLTEETTVRGLIPEVDQDDMTFEVQLIDGRKVKAPLLQPHMESVLEAFNGYKSGTRVMVQGVGSYSRNEKLQSFESIEHVTLLDALDVPTRLDELRLLKDGWIEGEGKALEKNNLDWFEEAFNNSYPDDLPLPHLYPTAGGGLQAEWTLGAVAVSLEIDLATRKASWQAVNLDTEHSEELELDLSQPIAWGELADKMRKQTGGQA